MNETTEQSPAPEGSAYETIKIEIDGEIAIVTLNRPRAMNALSLQMMADLRAAFTALRDDPEVRGVIITGARMAFAMGADIPDILATETPAASAALSKRGQELFTFIERLGKPTIAALNGLAMGGGLELALACTLRIAAAEKTVFGLPEINLGIIPGYGGTQRLPRLIGKGRALEMILTGEPIPADEALRIGLLNKVVPKAELLDEAKALMNKLLAKAPVALACILRAVNEGMEATLERGLDLESALFGMVRATADSNEGLSAFVERRDPKFTGR